MPFVVLLRPRCHYGRDNFLTCFDMVPPLVLRDGPLEKLLGGGGGRDGGVQKNIRAGKINEKKLCVSPLTLKNIHATT